MKEFKSRATRTGERYQINKSNFEEQTKNRYPYEQKSDISGHSSQYAYCPSCLNSIQLIGLYKKDAKRIYGKHTGTSIEGFDEFIYDKYVLCPYAAPDVRVSPTEEYDDIVIDEHVIELYDLLKSQFDRVVAIISKELGIRAGSQFWRNALRVFVNDAVFCYPWLTEANLPYIFAFRCLQHNNIYGLKFKVGSDLYNCLCKDNKVRFDILNENENEALEYAIFRNNGTYINYIMRFTQHKQIATEGECLKESLLFCLDDMQTGRTLYERKIIFDENVFMNYVKKSGENHRQMWLLEIANEIMQPLELPDIGLL